MVDYIKAAKKYGGRPSEKPDEQDTNQQAQSGRQQEPTDYLSRAQKYGGRPVETDEAATASLFGQSDFGASDIAFSERMRIASGDTFQERQNIFKNIYPEGDFQRVPSTGEFVFRRDPSESYKKYNPEGFESTDIAEFAGESGAPILGEIGIFALGALGGPGGAAATTGTRAVSAGRNVIQNITKAVVGAISGEETKQGYQSLTGVQEDDPKTAFINRPTGEGLLSLGGASIGEGVSRAFDALKGAGIFSLKPGGREALQAARRLEVDSPLPGQTTRLPVIARLQGQSGQTSSVIQNTLDRTNEQLTNRLSDLSSLSPRERQFAINTVVDSFEDTKTKMMLDLSSRTNLSNEDFGFYLKELTDTYKIESGKKVKETYNIARSFEEPSFDLSSLQEEATRIANTTKVNVREQGGRTLDEPVPEDIEDYLGDVRTIADQIRRADPDSVGVDQLQRWESRLFDLSQPDIVGGPVREVNKKARDLKKALKQTFDNPTNKGPEFGRAWSSARETAAKRFDTLEDSLVARIGKTDRPAEIANKVFDPSQVEPTDVRILRRVAGSEKFADIQAAFSDRLLQDPDKLSSALEAFDDDVLSQMLSPSQLKAFRNTAAAVENLNLTNIPKAASRQVEFQPFIRDLVTGESSTTRIDALFKFVNQNGGKDGSLGRIIRTGLIEELAKDTVQRASQRQGGRRVRVEAFNEALEDFSERGLNRFFNRTELRNLRDIVDVADFTDAQGEGVAALLGATASQQAAQGKLSGLYTLARNLGLGNILVSKTGRNLIQGVGNAPSRRDLIIPMVTTTRRVLEEDEELGGDDDMPNLSDVTEFLNNTAERVSE